VVVREGSDGGEFDLNFRAFRVDVTEEVEASGSIGIVHDVEVPFGTCAHVWKQVVNDPALGVVGLGRCFDVGTREELGLLELCPSDARLGPGALDLALIAIAKGKGKLDGGEEGIGAAVALVPAEEIRVREGESVLEGDVSVRRGHRGASGEDILALGEGDLKGYRGERVRSVDLICEDDGGGRWDAYLTKEIEAGECDVPVCDLQSDEDAIALNLYAEQIDATHGAGIDTLLVVADHVVHRGEILVEEIGDAKAGGGGPVAPGDAAGDDLKLEGLFGLRPTQVGTGDLDAFGTLTINLDGLGEVAVVFGVVGEAELVDPRADIFGGQIDARVGTQAGLPNLSADDIYLLLGDMGCGAELRSDDSLVQREVSRGALDRLGVLDGLGEGCSL